ncbi:PKD domain-containing protein [Candidatus Gracilibacteria bacterium]|nr:PKD domain-containing protein [Candidatus Gracilibacteria bacterium]
MDTPAQPQQQPAPAPQPTPVVAPVVAAPAPAPAPAPTTTTTVPAAKPGVAPVAPAKPGVPTQKSGKKIIWGCITAFGCSIFLVIAVVFGFVAFGNPETSPIFGFLGVPAGQVVNFLITLINFIFLFFVFVNFVVVIIGVFKRTTTKKEDKEGKKKANVFIFFASTALVFFIVLWTFAYFFLSQKRTAPILTSPIITEPVKTTGLTAPVTVKFDASKAPVNRRNFDVLSFNWDFGDDTKAKGEKQTHTYTSLGDYTAILTIELKDKTTAKESELTFSRDVTISNVLATVVIKADPSSGEAPLNVKFDGSSSSSDNGEITSYAWDLDADGEFDDGAEAQVEKTFDAVGSYVVKLQVTDSTGAPAVGETTIEVGAKNTPVADIKVEGVTGTNLVVGQSYIFNGAGSTTPTGSIEKFAWTFSDGGAAATRSATHVFKAPGTFEATLRVTNDKKETATTTQRFTVATASEAPIASIKTTPVAKDNVITGAAPFDVVFDASGSIDRNDNIIDYDWDFNEDGKSDEKNAIAKHTFSEAGTFTVSVIVTDATNFTDKETIVVKVDQQGLKVDVSADPVAGTAPLTVKFDASGSSYPEGRIVSYEWDFGDGGRPQINAAKVSHRYNQIGTFTVKVTAITQDGKRASANVPISVRPISLSACFEVSADKGKAPFTVSFDPTCSTGTVVKYKWNFANLKTSLERKPTFIFKDAGEYPVTLEVNDSENNVDVFSKTITVEP